MVYLIARKRVRSRHWSYIADAHKDKFLKFSKKEAQKAVKLLKQISDSYIYKIIKVEQ